MIGGDIYENFRAAGFPRTPVPPWAGCKLLILLTVTGETDLQSVATPYKSMLYSN